MAVSLIVPVYKAEPWIKECMDSIHAQTYKDIEVIVEPDPQATGAAAARNRGLAKATGEYVAFCDADDYLAPHAIEQMVEAIDGVDMVCGSFIKFGAFEQGVTHLGARLSRKRVAEYAMENMKNPRSHQMLSGCWAKLYRRNMCGNFPLLTTAEDMAFNYDYLRLCTRDVRFIPDVVYHNRKHGGTLSTTFNENDRRGLFGFLEALKYVDAFLRENLGQGMANEITDAVDSSKVYHSILYFSRICEQRGGTMRENLLRLYP